MIEPGSGENATPENPPSTPAAPVTVQETLYQRPVVWDAAAPVAPVTVQETVAPVESEPVLTKRGKLTMRFVIAFVIVILGVGGYLFFSQSDDGVDLAKIQGKVAMSEQELKDVVVAKKLTVYWAGPQAGAKYTLIATAPGISYIRYLPGGVGLNDTKTLFRAIGTYVQKNAYSVSLAAGKADGNVGFTNSDGNAVFYSKARPSNVYVGIKGKDIQVEVFDPVVDQALGLVLVRGQISLVN